MTTLTNPQAASSLAELFLNVKTQTKDGFQEFLRETGINSMLCRDSAATVDTLVGELTELVTKFGLDTDTYPDAAARIEQIQHSLYATSAILDEIADYAESSAADATTEAPASVENGETSTS